MARRLNGVKPISEPMLLLIGTLGTNFSEILIGIQTFSFIWKCRLQNGVHLSRPQCVNRNDNSTKGSRDLTQYKDAVLPVKEIPLNKYDDRKIV